MTAKWVSRFALFMVVALTVAYTQTASAQLRKKNRTIDDSEVQASSEAPGAAQVETIRLEYDRNLPQFIVVVEPFDYSASGITSGGGQATPDGSVATEVETYTVEQDGSYVSTWSTSYGPQIGAGIAKQLTSALSGWPNITLIEPDAITNNGDGTYSLRMQPGEVGPFIIRGTITEFSETAEADSSGKGFSSAQLGSAVSTLGRVFGGNSRPGRGAPVRRGSRYRGRPGGPGGPNNTVQAGQLIAAVGPEIQTQEMKRTGMIGMDVRVINGKTARVAPGGAFSSQGSFTSMSKGSNISMLGFSGGGEVSASSSLGQATRAAMNDALMKIRDALTNASRQAR